MPRIVLVSQAPSKPKGLFFTVALSCDQLHSFPSTSHWTYRLQPQLYGDPDREDEELDMDAHLDQSTDVMIEFSFFLFTILPPPLIPTSQSEEDDGFLDT
jgi:hypothetical protein